MCIESGPCFVYPPAKVPTGSSYGRSCGVTKLLYLTNRLNPSRGGASGVEL